MKVQFWCYMENMGDGSVAARFFNSEEEAEGYAEDHDERMCDDIELVTLEFDKNGKLLNPAKKIEY